MYIHRYIKTNIHVIYIYIYLYVYTTKHVCGGYIDPGTLPKIQCIRELPRKKQKTMHEGFLKEGTPIHPRFMKVGCC